MLERGEVASIAFLCESKRKISQCTRKYLELLGHIHGSFSRANPMYV